MLPSKVQEQVDQRCPCFAKPLAECDCEPVENPELAELGASLKTAMPGLEKAYRFMGDNKLDKRYPDLFMAVCDSLHSIREASEHLRDEPEIPEI